ncbi:DUF305 domain-containing protein [Sporichthya polymorpha]|uniref:DUF305 domain-containing protein n=1 Tax=Sporichthya polymorpha TaxID=35751 RepID=UPI00039F4D1A|nr:DUF305 domain-containing protein [Sporichthya polymorpha]
MTNRLLGSAALALAALTSVAVLAACGGGNDDAMQPAAATTFTAADVTFAQQMIPHHSQAVKMASLAATRAKDPAVKKLAAAIVAGQGPEIETMQSLLEAWDQPLVADMAGMDHSSMAPEDMMSMSAEMPGMAGEKDLKMLAAAKGAEFDRMFLTMMIEHHRGALQMAKTERSNGKDPAALKLAEQMETTQRSEIKKMQKLKNG